MAFYKNDNGTLIIGLTKVSSPAFVLEASNFDTYTYPVDGWYWFDSDDEAYTSLGIEKPVEQVDETPVL